MNQSLPEPKRTPTLLEQMGGVGGLVSSAVPAVAFVAVNPFAGLQAAIWASLGVAIAIGVWRLIRREPLQPAVSGILGVAVCAFIAYRTGEARGFFLYGIWYSLVAGLVLTLSVVVRRPLVGVLWEFLDPSPPDAADRPWHKRRPLFAAYAWATVAVTAVFLARGGVQAALYHRDATGWLAAARIVMGYPLFIAAVGLSFWLVRRARRTVSAGDHRAP